VEMPPPGDSASSGLMLRRIAPAIRLEAWLRPGAMMLALSTGPIETGPPRRLTISTGDRGRAT